MRKLVGWIALCTSLYAQAQEKDFRTWGILNVNQTLNEDWTFNSDIQYRMYEDWNQLNQLLVRGGIGYHMSPNNNTILLGYAYVLTRVPVGEH